MLFLGLAIVALAFGNPGLAIFLVILHFVFKTRITFYKD